MKYCPHGPNIESHVKSEPAERRLLIGRQLNHNSFSSSDWLLYRPDPAQDQEKFFNIYISRHKMLFMWA